MFDSLLPPMTALDGVSRNADQAPLVSIVLPVHNGARYLQQSLDSCLRQTHVNLEVIVVDDASSDETPRILSEFGDARIRCLRNSANIGLARSLNVGFDAASGDYLTWTSDDNVYDRAAIEVMVTCLEAEPEVGLVYTDYWQIDEDGVARQLVRLPDAGALSEVNCVNGCFLYRASVAAAIGQYDPDVAMAEDYDYWLRVGSRFSLRRLCKPLYYYRCHDASLTTRFGLDTQQAAAERARLKTLGPNPFVFPSRKARSLSRKLVDQGFGAHGRGDWRTRRTSILAAVANDPRWLRNRGVGSLLLRSLARWAAGREGTSGH